MGKFQQAVAGVTDSVRHELVERAWYGREVTGNIYGQPAEGDTQINHFYGKGVEVDTSATPGLTPQSEPEAAQDAPAASATAQATKIEAPAIEPPTPGY